jgi:hypothetical protein
MGLPQLLARLDVEKRHGEEDDGEDQHQKILHFRSRNSRRLEASKRSPLRRTKTMIGSLGFWSRKDFIRKP